MREVWRGLVAFEHRGTGTRLEREAAAWLAAYLEAHGFAPEVQRFRAPASWGPEVLAISLALGFGGLFGWAWLAAIGFYGFWAYFSGWPRPWQRLFARAQSQNVLAEAGEGPRTLVLMAHYDTAKTYFAYHPARVRGFRTQFLANAALAGLAVPLAWWGGVAGALVGAYFLAQAGLLGWRELKAPYVNGANDNASGVAVATRLFLDLARRPPAGWRVLLALTGAEETGAAGAERLLASGAVPADALVLNVDNVGAGTLHYATGEGMLAYYPHRGPLLAAARELEGAAPVAYRLAYFDTLPFARRGRAVLTLIRLAGGVPPNWHWPTDRPEHVRWDQVEETYAYARRLLERALPLKKGVVSAGGGG
ncbi:MAG TPA: M28 family peptidase [Oceanithermus profundus]|uniref:M28 family peptidase n=1 Tax=Oceanithermus profundus TaxID=187137 RepID=A0A7C4ZRM9_9DEIN|nr:M28 family peptidase [Oceanithermus profundus]